MILNEAISRKSIIKKWWTFFSFFKTRISLLLFVLSLLLSLPTKAQYTTFQRAYGDSTHDMGYGIVTEDNGMLFAWTQNPYQPNSRVLLIKTDSLGNEIWKRAFGDSVEPVEFRGLIPTKDTGCIISLWIGNSNFAVAIVKVDRSGNIIWSKPGSIPCGYEDYSGSYILLAGNTRSRFDSQGNYTGSIHYSDSTDVNPCWGIETSDSGSVIVGITRPYSSGGSNDWDGFISRMDKFGNLLWAKAIGTDSLEQFINVDETFDGGFIIVGKSALFGTPTTNDIWLVKVDASGNIQWSKTYGGISEDRGIYVKQTYGAPGYILIGETLGNETLYPGLRSFVYKVDINGNFQWGKIYGDISNGGFGDDYINYAYENQQGGFLLTGTVANFGAGMYDLWCIKTDNLGSSGCNEVSTIPSVLIPSLNTTTITTFQNLNFQYPALLPFSSVTANYTSTILCSNPPGLGVNEIGKEDDITIYPNPSSGIFNVKFEGIKAERKIAVYNMLGQDVHSVTEPGNAFSIDLTNQPSGIYFISIICGRQVIIRKIVKE
jgi:hypothetical protein